MTDSDRPTSTSAITAKGVAAVNVVAQLTELAAVFCATWLCAIERIDTNTWMGIVGACLFGPAVAKLRGTPPASSLVTALAMVPPAWLAAIKGTKLL